MRITKLPPQLWGVIMICVAIIIGDVASWFLPELKVVRQIDPFSPSMPYAFLVVLLLLAPRIPLLTLISFCALSAFFYALGLLLFGSDPELNWMIGFGTWRLVWSFVIPGAVIALLLSKRSRAFIDECA